MTSIKSKFWLENPCSLFSTFAFFPSEGMTKAEKLNALTRLALVIGAVMYFMKYDHTVTFIVIGLLVIVALNYSSEEKYKDMVLEDTQNTQNTQNVHPTTTTEDFTLVPTYVGTDFQQTVVTPTFAEEWQIPPPAYDLYTQVPYQSAQDTFEVPLDPKSYPYGQYLTRTNLLPSDEYYTHLGCGGAKSAREYVNSTFLRNDLAFQDNMMRIYKKKLNRRFRHNSQDTFSPFSSY